jgi:hypothetical protein
MDGKDPAAPQARVLLTLFCNAGGRERQRTNRWIDNDSLAFLGRTTKGTETIVVCSLWLVFLFLAWQIAVVWAIFLGISVVQRTFKPSGAVLTPASLPISLLTISAGARSAAAVECGSPREQGRS